MKNLFKYFVTATVAVAALLSCQREKLFNEDIPENSVKITVKASAADLIGEDGTKTYIDANKTIIWGTGEYMKLALTADGTTSFATSTDASADIFNGDDEALFAFSVTDPGASSYTYQGLYPASAAAASNNTNAANYKVNLPAIQNATASSYDPAAYIMVAKPETFTSLQTEWEASFRRGTALNKITLKNVPSGVSINKVKISSDGKHFAGGHHINLTTGENCDEEEYYNSYASIEVMYATALTGTNVDVWFTSWNAEIAEGEKLTIVAYTTDNKSYSKEITARENGIKFLEGYLNTLGVSLSGITPEDVSAVADGTYVILAKKDDSTFYALKGEASGTRIASVDYSGSMSNYSGDASIIWTIAASGSGYTIKNGSNYVGWNSGSGNAAALIAEADYDADKCLMGIAENGDGIYKIYVLADATRMLARNTSNAYFAFYAGTQYKDIVFVPATAMEQVATPEFDPAAGAVASGTTVSISCATSGATIHYTLDGTDPTSSSATYSTPISITAATTIKAIAVKSGMADSEIASAAYTISGSTPTTGWIETAFSSIGANEEFVIVGDNGNDTYALKANANSAPLAVAVTVSGTELIGTLDDAIKWTLSGDATNGFVFYPKGSTTTWLYTTTSNNGLRVGESANNKVKLDASSGYLTIYDGSTTRYIGIYSSQDWRSYTSVNSNISGQTFKFYKYVSAPDNRQEAGMSWSAASASASWDTGNTVSGFTAPTLTAGNATGITYESTNTDVATISNAGVVTIVGPGETVIKAIFDGDDDYKPATVTYTLTVTDNRETVATPEISPAAGTVASGTQVTISCSTSGATIHYTLDGSTPDGSSTVYSGAITLTESKTVKAIAVKTGYKDSAVASAAYSVGVVNTSTEANPYSAAEADALARQLANNGTLADVYVSGIISQITTAYNSQYNNVSFNISADGLTTSTQFLIYRAGATSADDFKVGDAVEFKGTLKNYYNTNNSTNTYELDAAATLIYQVHAPSFTPDGGSFTDSQSVTISADSGATIRYTDDGTTNPTASTGTVYSGALSLTATTTIKAVAILNGHVTGVVSRTFTKSSGSAPESVVYDFTGSGWSVSNGVLSNGTVSFTGQGGANFKMNDGYFMMGKTGAYINFPEYSNSVSKIVVTGRSGASASTKQNIFVGNNAVSTETTGVTGENTYNIASAYQTAGTIYTLKVTSSHNTQITKIEVFFN